MTPEKAHFQENLGLNQNSPEQLEKLKNDLKAKVDTLKADGSFSGEDLADLVDLLDDKTILSPTEAELKSHLETLQDLSTQIDFLMALVEVSKESKNEDNLENISENNNLEELEKLLKENNVEITKEAKNFLKEQTKENFNKLSNDEKSKLSEILISSFELETIDINIQDKNLFIEIIKLYNNKVFIGENQNNIEDKSSFILTLEKKLNKLGILNETLNIIGLKKEELENSQIYKESNIDKTLKENNLYITNIKEEDLKDNNKLKIIVESLKINNDKISFSFTYIKKELFQEFYNIVTNIPEFKNNNKIISEINKGIILNEKLNYDDIIKLPGIKEAFDEEMNIYMKNYNKNENIIDKSFKIENNSNLEENYKRLFSISYSKDLIKAIDHIFQNKEYFNEELFLKYLNPKSIDYNSLIKINNLLKTHKGLNTDFNKIDYNLIQLVTKDTISDFLNKNLENSENITKNEDIKKLKDFIDFLGWGNTNSQRYIIRNLFSDYPNIQENFLKEKIKEGKNLNFNNENFKNFIEKYGKDNPGLNLNELYLEFGENITEKDFFNNKDLQNFIINEIKKDEGNILTFNFLKNDNILNILIKEKPEIIKFLPENIREKPDFIKNFFILTLGKESSFLCKYLVINENNIEELLLKNKNSDIIEMINIIFKNGDFILTQKLNEIIDSLESVLYDEKNENNEEYKKNINNIINTFNEKKFKLDELNGKKLNEKELKDNKLNNDIDKLIQTNKIENKEEIKNQIKKFFETGNVEDFSILSKNLKNNEKAKFEIINLFKNFKIEENQQILDEQKNKAKDIIKKNNIKDLKKENFNIIENGEINSKELYNYFKKFLEKNPIELIENAGPVQKGKEIEQTQKLILFNNEYLDNFINTLGISDENLKENIKNLIKLEYDGQTLKSLDTKQIIKGLESGKNFNQIVYEQNIVNYAKLTNQDPNLLLNKINKQQVENNINSNFENSGFKEKNGIIFNENFAINTNNSEILTKSGDKIPVSPDEIKMLKSNPKIGENIIVLKEKLDTVGFSKLWNFRENIFKAVENISNGQFERDDGNYFDERETKILLNAILTSVGEKPVNQKLSIDSFITEVELKNDKQITGSEKQVNNYGETKLEKSFIEKFVGRGDMIGFKQSAFEDSLKKIN